MKRVRCTLTNQPALMDLANKSRTSKNVRTKRELWSSERPAEFHRLVEAAVERLIAVKTLVCSCRWLKRGFHTTERTERSRRNDRFYTCV